MMIEHRQDMMTLPHIGRIGVGTTPFEVLARPGPDVEVRVHMRRLEFWNCEGGRKDAVGAEVGGDGGAERKFLGVGGEGGERFGGGSLGGEDGCVGSYVGGWGWSDLGKTL